MSRQLDNCFLCNAPTDEAFLHDINGYDVSLWKSLCKIFQVTPDQSDWKKFASCRFCYSCHILVVQTTELHHKIESLQNELEDLSTRLKCVFRRTVISTEENASSSSIESNSNPLLSLRILLSKNLSHEPEVGDIIQLMPIWKEEFDVDDNDDGSYQQEIEEDEDSADNYCHDNSITNLGHYVEVEASCSSSDFVKEEVEVMRKTETLKNFQTFIVKGYVLKDAEIKLDRLSQNDVPDNHCASTSSRNFSVVESPPHDDSDDDSSWVADSEGSSEDEYGRRKRKRPGAPKRQYRKQKHRADDGDGHEEKFECQTCMKVLSSRKNLRRHMKAHEDKSNEEQSLGDAARQCQICSKTFKSRRGLRRHMEYHTGEDHVCDRCGKTYKVNKLLQKHILKHHPENPEEVSHKCKFCSSVLSSRLELLQHIRRNHTERKHICETCGRSFVEAANLRRHLFTHSEEKPFTCELCGKGVTDLQHHQISCREKQSTEEKQLKCSHCDKAFYHEASLKLHQYIHRNLGRYECDVCGKKYRLKCLLAEHRRIHSLDEHMPCNLCSARFRRPQDLKWHMEYEHLGNRDKCTICGYEAKTRVLFKLHERTHRLGRQYECDLCHKKFLTRFHLKRHRQTHEVSKTATQVNQDEESAPTSVNV